MRAHARGRKNKRGKNNPPLVLGEIIKSDFLRVYLFWYFFFGCLK